MTTTSQTRIAIVTGAAQGIGRAIAERLADDGLDLAINDLKAGPQLDSLKENIEAKGRRCLIVTADISIEKDVKQLVEKVVAELGGLDVFIANAGICLQKASLIDLSVDLWDKHFNVNARGTFLCYKYAGKQMISQGRGGRIVGASSIAGKTAMAGLAAYSATKAAISNLTTAAAQELGPHGITVNAYAPGTIETPMSTSFFETLADGALVGGALSDITDETKRRELLVKSVFDKSAAACSMRRNGKPEDIANLVSMFVKPESSYICGQTITCDGGRILI